VSSATSQPEASALSLHDALPISSVVQSGSLPIYLGVIVTSAILGPSIVMAGEWALPERLILAESPLQAVTAALVITAAIGTALRSEEHTSELQSRENLVCRLLLE